jgi:RNA polymerase sigma-70 factor (ECF subfamily)
VNPAVDGDGPDAVLVASAQRGNVGAFNGLALRYQRQVYNLCFRTLGNAEDASDATQEAFLGAYRGISSYRGSAEGFRSWLLRIAVNACHDQLRRRKRWPSQSLEALAEERGEERDASELAHDPTAGPEQRILTSETARRIQDGLARLAPDQRLTVILCDVQGLSYDEAARAMGVELGTVKSRLSRARVQLRDYLAAHGELPTTARRLDI